MKIRFIKRQELSCYVFLFIRIKTFRFTLVHNLFNISREIF